MTTTAASSSHAPQNPGAAHARTNGGQGTNGANGAQGDKAHGQRQAPADLFATLLALAADAAPVDGSATDPLAADGRDAQDPLDTQGRDDNPLAGLLMWQPPALDQTHPDLARASAANAGDTPATGTLPGALPGTASSAGAGSDARTTPAAEAEASARPAEPPAAAPRAQALSWQVAATRAAQVQTTPSPSGTGPVQGGSDVPAMRWSPAASSIDTAAWSSVRSTVTLDARFPASAAQAAVAAGNDEDGVPAAGAAPTGTYAGPAAVGGPGSTPQGDLSGGQSGGGDASERSTQATPEDKPAPGAEAYAASADEAVEVQHWGGAHGLRHASLRVGEDDGQAIDIQLALRGDELRLDIRTDDSAARSVLREQVHSALGERLQQGGLQLADVSVGSQQQERPRDGHVPTAQRGGPATGGAEAAPGGKPAAPEPRSTTRGLDLFV